MAYCGYQPDAVPLRLHHRQEASRTAGGETIVKDLGDPLWVGEYVTEPLSTREGADRDPLDFEAILRSLDGGIRQFEAGDLRRPYPRAHLTGNFTDDAYISAVQAGGGAIRINGCDSGFTVSRGDFFEFDHPDGTRALHQAVEGAVASGGGLTGFFEVRPYVREAGLFLSPAVTVRFKQPMGLFALVPGSVQSEMRGGLHTVVKFQAVQSVS